MTNTTYTTETGRPLMPDGYGVPENNETVLPWIGWEFPARTPGNEGQAFSVARAGVGMPVETKKARSVVALSRVPR